MTYREFRVIFPTPTELYNECDIITIYNEMTQEAFISTTSKLLAILAKKFDNWTLRYAKDVETKQDYTYMEFINIFMSVFPQFYYLEQKNRENILQSFAIMNNWGSQELNDISQLVVENYIPLNGDTGTPHTSTPTTTKYKKQIIDFIAYYNSLTKTHNVLFDSLLEEFLPLFRTIYI